jgi:hypothetical protein
MGEQEDLVIVMITFADKSLNIYTVIGFLKEETDEYISLYREIIENELCNSMKIPKERIRLMDELEVNFSSPKHFEHELVKFNTMWRM